MSKMSESKEIQQDPLYTEALRLLKLNYGYDSFRPHQWEIIEKFVRGTDVLTIQPTGAGKSILFQIAPLLFQFLNPSKPVITVGVISPMISLMNNQLMELKAMGDGIRGVALHSENENIEEDCIQVFEKHNIHLLYLAPESFSKYQTQLRQLYNDKILKGFVIDEAHCISEFGADYRPEFCSLHRIRDLFPSIPIIGATATATKQVQKHVVEQLRLNTPFILRIPPTRDNIYISVVQVPSIDLDRELTSIRIGNLNKGSCLIYCTTQKLATKVGEHVKNKLKIQTSAIFHGGIPAHQKKEIHQKFLSEEINVIACTTAFGMGINMPNICRVILIGLPYSVESFVQLFGRAGRGGMRAEIILIWSEKETFLTKKFILKDNKRALLLYELMYQYAKNQDQCRNTMLHYYFEQDSVLPSAITTTMSQKNQAKVESNTVFDFLKQKTANTQPCLNCNTCLRSKQQSVSVPGSNDNQIKKLEKKYLKPVALKTTKGTTPSKIFSKSSFTLLQKKILTELNKYRAQKAKEQGIMKYMIFQERTLIDLCTKLPTNDNDLLKIYGIGADRARKHGESILEIINKASK